MNKKTNARNGVKTKDTLLVNGKVGNLVTFVGFTDKEKELTMEKIAEIYSRRFKQ